MQKIGSFLEIINEYDGFLFDAYGVLVNDSQPLPGAKELLTRLRGLEKPYLILSNGSSRNARQATDRYCSLGLPLTYDQVVTSGSMLQSYLADNTSMGEKVAVLGTAGSRSLVADSRRIPVDPIAERGNYSCLVVANQTDYPFLESIDECLSEVCRKIDSGAEFRIIVTNPDLFYPKQGDNFGITAGSIAKVLESCLVARYGEIPDKLFVYLGKPFAPMFELAIEKLGSNKLLMVGDQILTDIQGAKGSGLGSLLLGTGLTKLDAINNFPTSLRPDYILDSLQV